MILQLTEDVRHLCKRRTIAKCSRFALDDRQIMAPVIDDPARLTVGPINDALMRADGLTLSDDGQSFWVNTKADRPVRKAGRHAIPSAFKRYQTRPLPGSAFAQQMSREGGHALAVFDKPVKSWW